MEVTSNYHLTKGNSILGLNEFFIGPKQMNTTLVYNFKADPSLEEQYLKSSGCMIYTGTGSTAWAQSINQISFKSFSNLIRQISGADISSEDIEKMYLSHKESNVFSHEDSQLRYIHRELFVGNINFILIKRSRKPGRQRRRIRV